MRIGTFKSLFGFLLSLDEPIMIVGHAGIGKSTVIRQAAQELGRSVKTVLLSQLEPGDLIGMPVVINGQTVFTRPTFLPDRPGEVLFLDEFNRAPLFVRQSVLQLLTDRQIGPHRLPEGAVIIAAINPSDDEYEVNEIIDQAVLTRFIWIKLQNDPTDYYNYLVQEFKDATLARAAVQTLINFEVFQKDVELPKIQPNPRAMSKAVKILNKAKELQIDEEILIELLSGVIGREAAIYLINQIDTVVLNEEDLYKPAFEKLRKASPTAKVEVLLRVLAYGEPEKVSSEALELYTDEELASVLRSVQADMEKYMVGYIKLYRCHFSRIRRVLAVS
ncbi:AAA family ATPase [Fervidobacterium islandicum]|uniref:AAA family ATPase n=1 Tax=Fervidobacterium islandicum TaxID=2423 RepID=UPI003A622AA7